MAKQFIEGSVYYPDWLPCPQLDTDLKPRERRYISDIGEVKKLRRFQSAFQATRQNIAFVFTKEQARDFQAWYKHDIIEGGAWFYADWPILHKETRIAYRFVTRPVWTFLALGNYHLSATVELYERKVGKVTNIYTSKLYPLIPTDDIKSYITGVWTNPDYEYSDRATLDVATFTGRMSGYIYSEYYYDERVCLTFPTFHVRVKDYIYSNYYTDDHIYNDVATFSGEISRWVITYDFYTEDALEHSLPIITSGAMR